MTQIYASTEISASVEAVFDYATTPANAPKWHPTSLGVGGEIDHSIERGERFTEDLQVLGGRRIHATWTGVERAFPHRWVIEGTLGGIARGTIINTFSAQGDGTYYEREFTYTMTNPLLVPINWLILRRRGEAEAREAVRRLKGILESKSD